MSQHSHEYQPIYQTSRLTVDEVSNDLNPNLKNELLLRVIEILTPKVVHSLPPYFHNISSIPLAQTWFSKVTHESRLLVIKHTQRHHIIGFIFIYEGDGNSAHIGYLLSENEWKKGYAKEFLVGLIDWCAHLSSVSSLIGGVEKSNIASAKLLENIGFVAIESNDKSTQFYQYQLQ